MEEAFVKLNINQWQIRAGRYEDFQGTLNSELSSGSFGISKNALPIPKVSLVISEYPSIPFTGDLLQFKGQVSYGWMRGGYTQDTLMHNKNLYIRAGRRNFGNVYHSSHFYPGLMQTYLMQEVTDRYQSWKAGATIVADLGALSNNFGVMLLLEYHVVPSDKGIDSKNL